MKALSASAPGFSGNAAVSPGAFALLYFGAAMQRACTVDMTGENPSKKGAVTGPATMNSFYASVLRVANTPSRGNGVHLA